MAGSLLGNPWLHLVRALPKGVEVPHAPLDVPCRHFISQAYSQGLSLWADADTGGIWASDKKGGGGAGQAGFTDMGSVHTAV